MNATERGFERQDGVVSLVMLVVLIPLLLTVGTYLMTMTGRSERLQIEITEERALLAVEAGIDLILHESRMGRLVHNSVLNTTLPDGSHISARAEYLGSNGYNDDDDLDTDEPDEDVVRVTVTGSNGVSRRRVAAYLGYVASPPLVDSALTFLHPNPTIDMKGAVRIDGRNYDNSLTLTGSGDTDGMSVVPPGTVVSLAAELTGGEPNMVRGQSGPPSLGVSAPMDLEPLVNEVRNSASVVITNSMANNFQFGNSDTPTSYLSYRDGNVTFRGNSRGAGLLVVTGDLEVGGNFRFDGVVVVLGRFTVGSGTPQINGGLLLGPGSSNLDLDGTVDIRYSSSAISIATNFSHRYTAFNGWQEITTN